MKINTFKILLFPLVRNYEKQTFPEVIIFDTAAENLEMKEDNQKYIKIFLRKTHKNMFPTHGSTFSYFSTFEKECFQFFLSPAYFFTFG